MTLQQPATRHHAQRTASAPHILVVDDSQMVRRTLDRQLSAMGARVTLAEDGRAAYTAALSAPFDLVIADVEMPGMDGLSLCRELRENPSTHSVPVVILSTLDSEEDIGRGFEAGASAYVPKSQTHQDLIPRVNEILGRSNLLRDRLFLVVDDSRLIRSTISESLIQAGFRVIEAENGRQALTLLDTHTPDIILSDIHMPVMDGADFCLAVRGMERLSGVPFVTMSTEGDRRVMREMVRRGASACLIKPFHPEQLVILAEKLLCDHVQMLLQEKQLLTAERNALLSSIASLIQALEARDVYTRGHSEAVEELSLMIGRELGLGTMDLDKLSIAAKLHDIGKIGIRDDILLKAGPLTPGEFETIKSHPAIGAGILSPLSRMAELVPAILHHHERYDGSGYPHGLSGQDIPLFARIIAVGDVFHSLTSLRPYRDPMALGEAVAFIRESAGTHLCPDCARAFEASLERRVA